MTRKIVTERRIYCKFCGAKLKKDLIGLYCPTNNCSWRHGLPENEPGAITKEVGS